MSDLQPRPGESLDPLNRRLRILQRVKGHRATTDDVLVAWLAVTTRPRARTYLDLGTGKGTVALLVLDALPQCEADGIEAFAQSHSLAVRNAHLNQLTGRFHPRLGDMRDPTVLPPEARYDLIGGAPPFMPLGSGVVPKDPQRAAGRFELKGGVEDYAAAAARWLAPDGAFALLMDGRGRQRGLDALDRAGLNCRRLIEVRPRAGRAATYTLYVAERVPGPLREEQLVVRDEDGWSPEYAAVRERLTLG